MNIIIEPKKVIDRFTKQYIQMGYGPRTAKKFAIKLCSIRAKRTPPK